MEQWKKKFLLRFGTKKNVCPWGLLISIDEFSISLSKSDSFGNVEGFCKWFVEEQEFIGKV